MRCSSNVVSEGCVLPVQIFSQPSSRIGLVYQSVCSRTIADRLYYNRIAEKKLDGHYCIIHNKLYILQRMVVYYPSKFFSAIQSFCSRLSVVLVSYDSGSTLLQLDRRIKFGRVVYNCNKAIENNTVWMSISHVDVVGNYKARNCTSSTVLLVFQSFCCRTIADQLQYDWMTNKSLDGLQCWTS